MGLPERPVVRSKTGDTQVGEQNLSRLVGAVEAQGKRFVFASRVRSSHSLSSTAGAELARKTLEARSTGAIGPR